MVLRKCRFAALVAIWLLSPSPLNSQDQPWRIVILHPTSLFDRGISQVDLAIREVFASQPHPYEIYSETFEINRFPNLEGPIANLLSLKEASTGADLVLADTGYALDFRSRHPNLWPKAQTVFFGLEERALSDYKLDSNTTGRTIREDVEGTVDLAFRFQPGAREVVITGGVLTGLYFKDLAVKYLQRMYPAVKVRALNDLPFSEQLVELGKLDPSVIVLYSQLFQDVTGRRFQFWDEAATVARASSAPVYTWGEFNLQQGFVGGRARDINEQGATAAQLALRVLNGEPAGSIPVQPSLPSKTIVDWTQLQRWGFSESAIPPDAEIINRPLSIWREYRRYVIVAVGVILLQLALIAGLFVQRVRRRKAEAEKRESESRFRSVANTVPVKIWMVNSEWQGEWVNKTRCDYLGTTLEENLGDGWGKAIHPDDLQALIEGRASADSKHEPFSVEYRLRQHDGQYRWHLSTAIPRFGVNGEFLGYMGSCVDISERKEDELRVQRMNAELAHLSRLSLMGELLASISHELNQPLTAIRTNAESGVRLIRRDPPDVEEVQECLLDIVRDDKRAGEIIANLRSLARRQDAKMTLLDMESLVSEVVTLIHGDAVRHHVSLSTSFNRPLPPVMGDSVQLQQVMVNMLLNAFAALSNVPQQDREVRVSVEPEGGKTLRVAVRDSGPGLTKEQMDRLFQPFFTTKSDGLGMGLRICKTIIDLHRGRLWVENNMEGGATFYFAIPAAAPKSSEGPHRPSEPGDAPLLREASA